MRLCKCGCGFQVVDSNNYIHGHNRRGLASCTTKGKWSIKYDKCISCGTTKRKHVGKGLCTKCHRALRYKLKKEGKVDRWARNYDKCINCGRIDRPHASNGLCGTCHVNNLNRKKGKPKRNFGAWSWYYNKCKKCGTIERSHAKNGLCYDCYEESKRDLSNNYKVCPICNVKMLKLNQHIAMRARKCEEHRKYQYDRLKICFDSNLNLHDIGKELSGMDRHSVTRQFVKYFGREATKKRNELVRCYNISDKAVINFNYKNMFGTIVEYDSPNQGKIRLRSKLEAKYAKWLDENSLDWFYEYKAFPYKDRGGRRRTYTPDFYLPSENKFIEVKGKNLLNENDIYKISQVRQAGISIEVEII